MRILRAVAPALFGVLLLAGPAQAATVTVEAKVKPELVNPKGPAGSGGLVTLDVNTDTNDMCWYISVEGLKGEITEVHIHDTFQGTDDPIVLRLPGLEGCLNALESAFFVSNAPRHDVDVHTKSFPNGALRGKFGYVGDPGEASPQAEERIKAQMSKFPVGTETDFTPKDESGALFKEGLTAKQEQEEAAGEDAGVAPAAPESATPAPETASTSNDSGAGSDWAAPLLVAALVVIGAGAGLGARRLRASRRA